MRSYCSSSPDSTTSFFFTLAFEHTIPDSSRPQYTAKHAQGTATPTYHPTGCHLVRSNGRQLASDANIDLPSAEWARQGTHQPISPEEPCAPRRDGIFYRWCVSMLKWCPLCH